MERAWISGAYADVITTPSMWKVTLLSSRRVSCPLCSARLQRRTRCGGDGAGTELWACGGAHASKRDRRRPASGHQVMWAPDASPLATEAGEGSLSSRLCQIKSEEHGEPLLARPQETAERGWSQTPCPETGEVLSSV